MNSRKVAKSSCPKSMSSRVFRKALAITAVLFFGASSVFASTQESLQGTAEVAKAHIITMQVPSTINFSPTFLPASPTPIYITLDPGVTSSTLRISDLDQDRAFSVNIALTNLSSGGEVIPYSKVSLVTLSAMPGSIIDGTPNNSPRPPYDSGSFDISQYCPWNRTSYPGVKMEDFCAAWFRNFDESLIRTKFLATDINPGDTQVTLDSTTGLYNTCSDSSTQLCVVRINGNDDVLYSSISGNRLVDTKGIGIAHSQFAPVRQYRRDSSNNIYTIISTETPEYLGLFSMGFGLKIDLDPNLKPATHSDTYSGILTFTLITT